MRWTFDFISPYAYLQSTRLQELAAIEPVECVPVLFAGLLGHWGQLGPAELPPKRQWTFEHVAWLAHRDGIALKMPASHPFNPLPLLRLAQVLGNSLPIVQRLFAFVWVEGKIPQDHAAFAALLDEVGVEAGALDAAPVKEAIRRNTDAAIAEGVFGVPTVSFGGRRFWGYDATDMVLASAAARGDEAIFPAQSIAAAARMPEGPGRPRRTADAHPTDTKHLAPRLPYLPEDLDTPADLVAAIRARRGGRLIELDRMLLHSPALAEGWNHMMGAVRTRLGLGERVRELSMCTVAVINRADYEFHHHAPLFISAGGTADQVAALRDPSQAVERADLFDASDRAALQLCIEMTRDVQVRDATFTAMRAHLDDRSLVELIATIAAYNMVSRFLVALNIQPQPEYAIARS